MNFLEHQKTWRDPTGRFPYDIRGTSRAARMTGFEVAGIFLDCGVRSDMQPRAVLITHTHLDHASELGQICMNKQDTFNIFCGADAVAPLQQYFTAIAALRASSTRVQSNPILFKGKLKVIGEEYVALGQTETNEWHPNTSEHFKTLFVRAMPLKHSIPDMGYIIAQKLMGRFQPLLAYLCDGNSQSIGDTIDSMAADMPYVVMLECTYLRDTVEARARKHVCWTEIQPTLLRYPKTTFLLFHFSLRHNEKELRQFASTLPPHIVALI